MAKELNDNAKTVLAALRASDKAMTIAELSAQVGFKVQPGTMTGLVNAGLVEKGDKVIVETPDTKTAATYVFATDEIGTNAKGEAYTYSDKENAILAALKASGTAMTLAQISEAVGFDVKSGNINSLVTKKGNVTKGEDVEVPCIKKSEVLTYSATDAE